MPFDPTITLCSRKELQTHLSVGRDFIAAMVYEGFPMPGGRATVRNALKWLEDHPDFRRKDTIKKMWPSESERAIRQSHQRIRNLKPRA